MDHMHILTVYFVKIHCNIIFPTRPEFPARYIPRMPRPTCFEHPYNYLVKRTNHEVFFIHFTNPPATSSLSARKPGKIIRFYV